MKTTELTALALSSTLSAAQAAARPMRILLVNDDGYQSMGITSLQSKLAAKGYDAWMTAPATDQSGQGSAMTISPNHAFEVKTVGDKQYGFPGTPSDSLDFGLLGVLKDTPPDLVISGVNYGQNNGGNLQNSGTVSAAALAIRYGYPTIAASIGMLMSEDEAKAGFPSTKLYWPDAVDYVVNMVDALAQNWTPGETILPYGTGVNVNYPALPKDKILGRKFVLNDLHAKPMFSYEIQPDGTATQVINPDALTPTAGNTDVNLLNEGYITYTVIDSDWNAPQFDMSYAYAFDAPELKHP